MGIPPGAAPRWPRICHAHGVGRVATASGQPIEDCTDCDQTHHGDKGLGRVAAKTGQRWHYKAVAPGWEDDAAVVPGEVPGCCEFVRGMRSGAGHAAFESVDLEGCMTLRHPCRARISDTDSRNAKRNAVACVETWERGAGVRQSTAMPWSISQFRSSSHCTDLTPGWASTIRRASVWTPAKAFSAATNSGSRVSRGFRLGSIARIIR